MPANLILKRGTGTNGRVPNDALQGSPSFVYFSTIDDATLSPGSAPIGRPATATAYSAEVHLYLTISNAPDNQVDNIRFWRGLSHPATGIHLFVGTSVASATPVTNTLSAYATEPSVTYYDSDNSLLWSDKPMQNIGDTSHLLIQQLQVLSSASIGDESGEDGVCHYSYDES